MYSINQKKCWNRMNPIAFTYLQDNQLSANNLTKIQTPLNCRQTDSKSLDYLKYKRSLDQNPQRKLQKLQTINMTINPEQIKLQPKMIVQKFNKQVQYDLETDSRFYKKYASQNQSLDAYTNHKVKREQLEAKKNMQSKLKNKNIQIDPQKLIEYAERQYFKILHRPQKLRLPSLDNQLISPKKGDFISEYHRSFKSQKKKQQQEKLIQHDFSYVSIRKQLRKINPTYTSSLKNPLSDLNFQIKLIPHD